MRLNDPMWQKHMALSPTPGAIDHYRRVLRAIIKKLEYIEPEELTQAERQILRLAKNGLIGQLEKQK